MRKTLTSPLNNTTIGAVIYPFNDGIWWPVQSEEILRQLGKRKAEAQGRYREFVHAGVEGASIWEGLKGQSLLGGEGFVEGLIGYAKAKEEIKEIPKGQRYLGRPSLEKLFHGSRNRKAVRDRMIADAVRRYGYSQLVAPPAASYSSQGTSQTTTPLSSARRN